MIILQTLPAVAIALYTRWLHRWALVAGWVVGMGYGLYLLWLIPNPASGQAHFGGSALTLDKLTLLGWHPFAGSPVQIYVGFVALVVNLVVAVVVTLVLRAGRWREGEDATHPADYHADEGSRPVAPGGRRGGGRHVAELRRGPSSGERPHCSPSGGTAVVADHGVDRCTSVGRTYQKWGTCIDGASRTVAGSDHLGVRSVAG